LINKKSIFFLFSLCVLVLLVAGEFLYLQNTHSQTQVQKMKKRLYYSWTALPDLALNQQTPAIRNKTLAPHYEIYPYTQDIVAQNTQSFILSTER